MARGWKLPPYQSIAALLGSSPLRTGWSVLVLLGLAGCTTYQPVDWDGRGSWSAAQQSSLYSGTETDPRAARHRVVSGETLSELAVRYSAPLSTLARMNGIDEPYRAMPVSS